MVTSRLTREKRGALLGGVCAGIAATYHLDVTLVRVALVALTVLSGGLGVCFYLAAWLIMPGPGQESTPASEIARANVDDIVATARQRAQNLRHTSLQGAAASARAATTRAFQLAADAARGSRAAFGGAAPATSSAGAGAGPTWTPPPSNPRARHGGFKPPRTTPPTERR